MKRYIVLSVNYNVDYLYYLPLCVWAWRKFGWEPIVFYNGPITDCSELIEDTFVKLHDGMTAEMKGYYRLKSFIVNDIQGYRSDTITQVSRLYAGGIHTQDFMMTGDIDMIPLSDYWHPNEDEITIYGHDLTGYGNYPICYLAMSARHWIQVMGLQGTFNVMIERDLKAIPKASSPRWEDYWETDQDLITKRLNETQFKKTFITRGQLPNGYARGRVDRGAWNLDHPELIDAHLLRDCYKNSETGRQNLAKTLQLLHRVWPDENFDWLVEYTREFQRLANNG